VGELLAILESLRGSNNAIVLTTSKYSKGVDFLFAVPQAYVIHTELPTSMVQFKQDSGRGVRGSDLPIIGALFTNKPYTTIQQVELGLSFQEQFDKLYPSDYLTSLNYLQKCSPTTEPQLKILDEAVSMLNEGDTSGNIGAKLS
jgi:hypothetical protein